MPRYHLNPHTGDAGKCRASSGPCPFGMEEAHYATEGEALAAYEAKMAAPKVSLKKLTRLTLKEALYAEAPATPAELQRLEAAVELADALHEGQTRKAVINGRVGTPYVEHPYRNALRLLRMGVTDMEVIEACVLHDTVEDCGKKFCELEKLPYAGEAEARKLMIVHIGKKFSPRTAELVLGVTNPIASPKPTDKAEKDRRYQAQVAKEIQSDPSVFLVKWSDIIDNAGSLHYSRPHEVESAKKRARKYLPVIPKFLEALQTHQAHYAPEVRDELRKKLVLTELRMKDLLTWGEN